MWLLHDGRQHVVFVDPKGIRNLGPNDPKVQFYQTIKEIEARLGDASIRLDSFIVVKARWAAVHGQAPGFMQAPSIQRIAH